MKTTDFIEFLRKINNRPQVACLGDLRAVLFDWLVLSQYQVLFIYNIINDVELDVICYHL